MARWSCTRWGPRRHARRSCSAWLWAQTALSTSPTAPSRAPTRWQPHAHCRSRSRTSGFDLVLCGRNSVDSETGQVGPEIAELLGVPQVTNVRKLDFDEAALSVRVERLTDEGHEVVMARLPALVTVGEDVAEEVYPRREALQEAQSKPIAEVSAALLSADPGDFGIDGSPTWVGEIYSVEPERDGIIVRDVDTDEAIERLLAYLDERGAFDQDSNAASEAPQRGGPREKVRPPARSGCSPRCLGRRSGR